MPEQRARALWLLMAFVLFAGAATLVAQPSRELVSGETRSWHPVSRSGGPGLHLLR